VFEKRGNISNINVLIQKRVVFGFPKKNSANVTFSFMMSPSDLLTTQVLNAFRTLHNSFIIERHTKLPQVQTEFSVAKTKVKEMENVSIFHFIPHIQSCIAFSMQLK